MKVNGKGSFTVEATLVMPIVIFVVITLIYIIFYLHDLTYLKTVAHSLTEKGAKTILYEGRQMADGAIDYEKLNEPWVYWRWTKDYEEGLQGLLDEARTLLNTGLLQVRGKDVSLSMTVEKGLINHYLIVSFDAPFEVPFSIINYLINGKDTLRIQVSSKAYMPDTTEFIRNVQMIDQITDEITIIQKGKAAYEEGIEKLEDMLKEGAQ